MKKNNFTKIMQNSLNEESMRDYYLRMYTVKKKTAKEEEDEAHNLELEKLRKKIALEKEQLAFDKEKLAFEKEKAEYKKIADDEEYKRKKEQRDFDWEKEKYGKVSASEKYTKDVENEERKIKEKEKLIAEMDEYNSKVGKLFDEYDNKDEAIDEKIKKETDTDKINKLKEEKEALIKKYDMKLKVLFGSCSFAARSELKKENAAVLSVKDYLTEARIEERELSVLEEKVIFGDTLDFIEGVELLEKSKYTSAGNLNQALKNYQMVLKLFKQGKATQVDVNKAKAILDAIKGDFTIDSHTQNIKDTVSGEPIREEKENPAIEAKEKAIENKEKQIAQEKNRESRDMQRKEDSLNKMKEQLKSVKEKTNDQNATATTALTEKMETVNKAETIVDFSNFSKTLFDGDSGNALKYAINGEINNVNAVDIEAVKLLMKKPEAQTIIKKLKFYLRKTASGISYEEYINLKVLKGQFKTLLNEAKKEYKNRFKN